MAPTDVYGHCGLGIRQFLPGVQSDITSARNSFWAVEMKIHLRRRVLFTVTKTTQGAHSLCPGLPIPAPAPPLPSCPVQWAFGMATSFTKNGAHPRLRELNFQPKRPRCAMPVLPLRAARALQDANTFAAAKAIPAITTASSNSCPAGGGDWANGASTPWRHGQRRKRGKAVLCVQRYHPVCAQGRRVRCFEQTMRMAARTCRSPFGFHPISVASDVQPEWILPA